MCGHKNRCVTSSTWPQIFLWVLKDNDLTGMAFIDTQLYIHQMMSIKNFILAADLMKSISLLRYQEESKTLSLVSRVRKEDSRSSCSASAAALKTSCLGFNCFLTVLGDRIQSLWRSTASNSWWITTSLASWVITVQSFRSKLDIIIKKNVLTFVFFVPFSVRPRQEPLCLHVFTRRYVKSQEHTAKINSNCA